MALTKHAYGELIGYQNCLGFSENGSWSCKNTTGLNTPFITAESDDLPKEPQRLRSLNEVEQSRIACGYYGGKHPCQESGALQNSRKGGMVYVPSLPSSMESIYGSRSPVIVC